MRKSRFISLTLAMVILTVTLSGCILVHPRHLHGSAGVHIHAGHRHGANCGHVYRNGAWFSVGVGIGH